MRTSSTPSGNDLSVGDRLTAWSPAGPVDAWEVAALEPERFLGLHGLSDLRGRVLDPSQPRPASYTEGLWGFLLEELPPGRTRLIVGGYQTFRPRWLEGFFNFWVYPPVHWPMQVTTVRQHQAKRRGNRGGRRTGAQVASGPVGCAGGRAVAGVRAGMTTSVTVRR